MRQLFQRSRSSLLIVAPLHAIWKVRTASLVNVPCEFPSALPMQTVHDGEDARHLAIPAETEADDARATALPQGVVADVAKNAAIVRHPGRIHGSHYLRQGRALEAKEELLCQPCAGDIRAARFVFSVSPTGGIVSISGSAARNCKKSQKPPAHLRPRVVQLDSSFLEQSKESTPQRSEGDVEGNRARQLTAQLRFSLRPARHRLDCGLGLNRGLCHSALSTRNRQLETRLTTIRILTHL